MNVSVSGPGRGGFPPTHWSVVLAAGTGDSSRAAEALAELCQVYWYPLYAYARGLGRSSEDAQDLTQGFFEHMLESGLVASADATKGRFRSFLLQCFRNFIASDHAKAACQKRGGGKPILSLDTAGAEAKFAREISDHGSPDSIYERNWARAVLDDVMVQLEQEFAANGRERAFRILRPLLQGDDDAWSCAEVAKELATSTQTVRVMVYRLRRRYRERLNAVVLRTVGSAAEVDDELRYLLQALQG